MALKDDPNANLPAQPAWATVAQVDDLAKAFWHAHALADRATAPPQEPFETLSGRVYAARKLVLAALELLVNKGTLDGDAYRAITAGSGVLDACADVTSGAQKLTAAGEVGLVGADRLAAAVADAETLQARVRPGSVRGGFGKTGDVADAAQLRDRVFTLLVAAHREVRRIGLCNWVDDAHRHVPTLWARRER